MIYVLLDQTIKTTDLSPACALASLDQQNPTCMEGFGTCWVLLPLSKTHVLNVFVDGQIFILFALVLKGLFGTWDFGLGWGLLSK
jgi:hypothetical protein